MSSLVWKGYLLHAEPTFTIVQSPFTHHGERVFGADSDATTLAVAAVQHRLAEQSIESVTVPEGIDASTLTSSTSILIADETTFEACEWDLLLSDEATVVLMRRGSDVELPQFDVDLPVDEEFYNALNEAWGQEMNVTNVSQGAYVSVAQYEEAASSRLGLIGQKFNGGVTWPRVKWTAKHVLMEKSLPWHTSGRCNLGLVFLPPEHLLNSRPVHHCWVESLRYCFA